MEVSWDTMHFIAYNGYMGEEYDWEALELLEDADRLSRRYQDERFPPVIRFFSHEGKLSLAEDWD